MDYETIDERQMVGFVTSRLPYATSSDQIPIIGQESLIQTLKKPILTIANTIMSAKSMTVTKKRTGNPTITRKAMDTFMSYVR